MYVRTIVKPWSSTPDEREEIPDVFMGGDQPREHVDVLPRMRAIATLWDAGRGPLYNWAVFANDWTFITNV